MENTVIVSIVRFVYYVREGNYRECYLCEICVLCEKMREMGNTVTVSSVRFV